MLDETKKKLALEWLYTHCHDKWFNPRVLDKTINPDPTLTEIFSPPEYHSIFESLRKEEFILPVVNQHGQPCFIMNQMKGQEWVDKIADTNPSLSRVVGQYGKRGFTFAAKEVVSVLIGSVVGSAIGYVVAVFQQ